MGPEGASLEEIEEVYRHRLDVFVRVATAALGSREGARDAVHDGFARAVVKRRTFRHDGSLEGWLWRFVFRAAQDTRERPRLLTETAEASRNGYEPSELDVVRRAVAGLPERQRQIVFLRYYADLGYAAIAEAVGAGGDRSRSSAGTQSARCSPSRSSAHGSADAHACTEAN